ncbi:lck-interacting transmembrane adapter 1 isoform X2 [Mixophyes fleayi]|uniref:lck-interacting transmembrane adapter 1 isoform X2 n=1 Tax=Mixophyes fleayi TaxID=3061075 RepID=UPI003F4DD167
MAPGPVTRVSPDHILPICSALGLFLLLCGLCTLCKRRKKRKMRNVCSRGVALVDVTLLRQTQLRSLSKSDTKLHEIQRPRPGDAQLRPVSMDPLYHSSQWRLQNAPTGDDATYSNLNYNPQPLKISLYESVGSREEMECSRSECEVSAVTAEYACVRKVKKGGNRGALEAKKEEKIHSTPPTEDPCLPNRPDELRLEEMYSKVNKKKKPAGREKTQGSINMGAKCISHPGFPTLQPEENLYESICEMNSHSKESASSQGANTEF